MYIDKGCCQAFTPNRNENLPEKKKGEAMETKQRKCTTVANKRCTTMKTRLTNSEKHSTFPS